MAELVPLIKVNKNPFVLFVFVSSFLVLFLLFSFFVLLFVFFNTLDAERLARSQYSEGPATGHLDTGFSWFPCA